MNPYNEEPHIWPLTEEVLDWLESDDDRLTTNDAIVEILDDLQAINAELLAALEAIAHEPLTDDMEASPSACLAEAVRIAERAIAKAKAGKE